MNRRMSFFILGKILLIEALLMLPSVVVGLIYREYDAMLSFLPSIGILLTLGLLSRLLRPRDTAIYAKDGFVVVALAWILLSVFGAIPFVLSGAIPSYIDAFFEIVSGFTTTGATILSDVEALPKCLLFWRSFSHWIGGMGVLVFVLAVMPMSGDRTLHLMRAEVPGPTVGKLVPQMRKTARILYAVYAVMTVILVVFLLFGKMPLFDAICHAFGTAGTGGFSIRNAGIAFYDSAYIDVVISVFMILFGINFNLYYLILIGRVKEALRSEELRSFLLIALAATAAIFANTYHLYHSVGTTLRHAFFQVSSIISTTGYASVDFANVWPLFSQGVLVLLTVIGACAGSTAGGLKVGRIGLLCKSAFQGVRKAIHPRAVTPVRYEGKPVDTAVIHSTLVYFVLYVLIICASTLLLLLDVGDFTTALTAELTCINNVGPGLSAVGPMENFGFFHGAAKLLLSLNMLIGRLEIFPMIVLFSPSVWRKNVN
ncbi:MAG: TrkH family potassium uptake protein [Clostridia bacterium]|nr:TrkH family potassium uptake protein [Clostridia bacterium]